KAIGVVGDFYFQLQDIFKVGLHRLTVHAFRVASLHCAKTWIEGSRCADAKLLRPVSHFLFHHSHQRLHLVENEVVTVLSSRRQPITKQNVFQSAGAKHGTFGFGAAEVDTPEEVGGWSNEGFEVLSLY